SSWTVPIGRPIPNVRFHVLDKYRNLVPPGVSGELYVGGVCLARGYLNKPELSEEKFIADPFSAAPGARLYRTGDLVRWRDDGELEFLGRTDDQVKIRGIRVELGEIESALGRHEGVARCVVTATAAEQGTRQLVAYYVARKDSLDPGALRAYLKELLPDYMIPGAFVRLDAMPLTANGKVDRKSLPKPSLDAY